MQPPPVDLPPNEPKCLPKTHCSQATTCARWLIRYTPGRPVQDCTLTIGFVQGKCGHFLAATEHRNGVAAPAPTVHEAPGWMK